MASKWVFIGGGGENAPPPLQELIAHKLYRSRVNQVFIEYGLVLRVTKIS